jgi:hypothetical protein
MEPLRNIEEAVRSRLNVTAAAALHDRVLARIRQAQEQSPRTKSVTAKPRIRRLTMSIRVRSWKVAAVIAVVIGLGAISVVGVNIGRYYYYGKTDAGDHIFVSEDRQDVVTMDANGVTDVEQTRTDLQEIASLRQQNKRELLRVEETTMAGTVEMRMHEYKYTLSDGRTEEMREGMKWGGGFDDEKRWQEWRQLKEAGPGEDLGTYEETVEGRVFSFQRERYVLRDGTEIIWSVGLPKDVR